MQRGSHRPLIDGREVSLRCWGQMSHGVENRIRGEETQMVRMDDNVEFYHKKDANILLQK